MEKIFLGGGGPARQAPNNPLVERGEVERVEIVVEKRLVRDGEENANNLFANGRGVLDDLPLRV